MLVEDCKAMATHVADGLQREGYVVDHVERGRDALQRLRMIEYDLLLFDVLLPDLNGLELTKTVRQTNTSIPVLFLSAMTTVDDRVRGLAIGGDDYLAKPFAFSELLARVQALLRRSNRTLVMDNHLDVADLRLDLSRRKAYRGSNEIALQPLEFKLLHYMMRNKGRVLSKTLIMEQMWDLSFNPGSNVVEVRMHHLRSKVDKPFPRPLIHTVRGVGYVLENR